MAGRLANMEGVFPGTLKRSNLAAALRKARQPGPDATVVAFMCDMGFKYLSTPLRRG